MLRLCPWPTSVLYLDSGQPAAPASASRPRPSPPGVVDLAAAAQHVTLDSLDPATTPGQAYSLRIAPASPSSTTNPGPGTIHIHAGSSAGLRHARATLAQLRRLFPSHSPDSHCPALLISDRPALAVRGVMLDVSRNRVPTMRELFDLAHTLAALKCNHLQLYTEHTFAYTQHHEISAGCGPLTPDEIRRLDAHCRDLGIELAANQNCFGHLARWLRHPRYAHLAETHGDWLFDVWPRSGPFSLCPTDPASLQLVRGWLDELLPCFTSNLVNIGCDETYDVGHGRSRDAVAARGRAAVYLHFVARIADLCRSRGKRPMFWADIALSHPDSVADWPADLLALLWGYEPDSPFERWCESTAHHPAGAWLCPGTSSWRTFTGRTRERTGNLAAAIAAATSPARRPGHIGGFLVCDWGDVGHRQTWPVALFGIAHGLSAAWTGSAHAPTGEPHNPDTLAPAIALHAGLAPASPDLADRLGPWLWNLGDLDQPLRSTCGRLSRPELPDPSPLRNQSALFADLHTPLHLRADVGDPRAWHDALDRVADFRTQLARFARDLSPLIADELTHALDCCDLALRRATARRAAANDASATSPASSVSPVSPAGLAALRAAAPDLLARLDALDADHRRLWTIRSRPGGLDESLAHTRAAREELALTLA